jgi:hypothetical protein
MSANWFVTRPSPARSVIENELRLSFWKAGLSAMWFSCTRAIVPFECLGFWDEKEFLIEWEPMNYLFLRMKAPNQDLLLAFERVLGHKALAAYRDGDGTVVVEWRVKDSDVRFDELREKGAPDLERLDGK